MTLGASEAKRKAVHVGMAGFALLLRWLDWRGAALCALAALAFNLFALPRLGGKALDRDGDRARGYPIGILLYPVVVLLLVLLFRDRLHLAAAGWGYLALGDGGATLLGTTLGGPALPWNRTKTWAGLLGYAVLGAAGAALLFGWVRGAAPGGPEALALALGALAGAVVESLPCELDDNLTAPLSAAAVLALFLGVLPPAGPAVEGGLRWLLVSAGVNAAVASLALALRVVRPSGALAGGLYGAVVLAFGGWKAYALLWVFFGAGTVVTRLGKARKEAIGKAEEAGGRRGAANVLANVTVPALLVAASALAPPAAKAPLLLAASAAFATALMDTVGTEVGQALKTPTFLLPDFRPAAPGTDGAVSVAGTLAGLLAAALLGLVAARLFGWPGASVPAVVASAFAGTVAESLLGRDGAPWKVTNGHVLNLFNTALGAWAAFALAPLAFR